MMGQRMARPQSVGAPNTGWRQLLALVLLFVALSVGFLVLDRQQVLDPLKGLAEPPVRAAAGAMTDAGAGLSRFADRFGDAEALREENRRLRAENAALKADAARAEELERENEQLAAQANLAAKFPQYQNLPARVIGRDPANRQKYLIVNRGAEDGIAVGMPAVSPDFLVGLVTAVEPKRARIMLLIDEEAPPIGVQLQQERSLGILRGQWQRGGRLTMEYVDRTITVPPNALVITSGLMTVGVPEGLIVGFTVGANKDVQNDSQTIEVWPYINFDALETVTIVLTNR